MEHKKQDPQWTVCAEKQVVRTPERPFDPDTIIAEVHETCDSWQAAYTLLERELKGLGARFAHDQFDECDGCLAKISPMTEYLALTIVEEPVWSAQPDGPHLPPNQSDTMARFCPDCSRRVKHSLRLSL